MDVLELALVVDAQVGDLHAEGRNAVAVAALPLRDADVRFRAQRGGGSQLPVDVVFLMHSFSVLSFSHIVSHWL
jgi:hypothetical protein